MLECYGDHISSDTATPAASTNPRPVAPTVPKLKDSSTMSRNPNSFLRHKLWQRRRSTVVAENGLADNESPLLGRVRPRRRSSL